MVQLPYLRACTADPFAKRGGNKSRHGKAEQKGIPMYPFTTWQEMFEAQAPLTFEEARSFHRFYDSWGPAFVAHNMRAPQYLLSAYLYHREENYCSACRWNYAGHAVGMAMANEAWGWTLP